MASSAETQTIEELLNIIANTQKGEDMRSAIHDAIEKVANSLTAHINDDESDESYKGMHHIEANYPRTEGTFRLLLVVDEQGDHSMVWVSE